MEVTCSIHTVLFSSEFHIVLYLLYLRQHRCVVHVVMVVNLCTLMKKTMLLCAGLENSERQGSHTIELKSTYSRYAHCMRVRLHAYLHDIVTVACVTSMVKNTVCIIMLLGSYQFLLYV